MYYKLELTPDGLINVLDYVDKKQDDEFIYATESELNELKKSKVVSYLDSLQGSMLDNHKR